jgi:hypothetical protein
LATDPESNERKAGQGIRDAEAVRGGLMNDWKPIAQPGIAGWIFTQQRITTT